MVFKNPLVHRRRFAFYPLRTVLFGWRSPRVAGAPKPLRCSGEAVLDTIEAALAEQMSGAVRRGKLVR